MKNKISFLNNSLYSDQYDTLMVCKSDSSGQDARKFLKGIGIGII